MNNPNKNHHNHRKDHGGEQPPEPVKESVKECWGCAAGHLEPFPAGAMGIPIVSEQEVLMGMLTRTKMPFLFTPADEDEGCTVIAIPLGDGADENGDPDTFDMVFCFDQYGQCIETSLE